VDLGHSFAPFYYWNSKVTNDVSCLLPVASSSVSSSISTYQHLWM